MIMTQKEMLFIVQSQLAIDLNCSIDDLNGERDSIIFVEAKENPGRRPFPRKARYFEIVFMGKSIVVGYIRTVVNCQNTDAGQRQGYRILLAIYQRSLLAFSA